MFRKHVLIVRRAKIVLYSLWYHHTYRWPSRARDGHLEGGEWSAARPGHTLPPRNTRYPLYRRLGGPQSRSGRAENPVPTGIRSRTIQPIAPLSYPAHTILLLGIPKQSSVFFFSPSKQIQNAWLTTASFQTLSNSPFISHPATDRVFGSTEGCGGNQ